MLELKGSMVGWYKSFCVAGLMCNTGYGYVLSAAVQLLIVHYCPVWLVPLLPLASVTHKGYLGASATPMALDASVMAWQCHGSSVLLPTTSVLGAVGLHLHWGIGGDSLLWGPCERHLMCAKLSPLNLGALVNRDLVLSTCHSPSHFFPSFLLVGGLKLSHWA